LLQFSVSGQQGRQALFAIADHHQVDEFRQGFGIIRLGTADQDDRVVFAPLAAAQRDAGQVEHRQQVAVMHLVLDGDGEEVGFAHGVAIVPREQADAFPAHDLLGVDPGAIDAFRARPVDVVANPVQDVAAQMADADGVGVGKRDRHSNLGRFPASRLGQLVDFAADVLRRLPDAGQEPFRYDLLELAHGSTAMIVCRRGPQHRPGSA